MSTPSTNNLFLGFYFYHNNDILDQPRPSSPSTWDVRGPSVCWEVVEIREMKGEQWEMREMMGEQHNNKVMGDDSR